jgi:DNA-binding XRE family transcriptional regulator
VQGSYAYEFEVAQHDERGSQVEQRALQLCVAFGRRLRRARLHAGLTERDIELQTGVSRECLGAIETGTADPTLQIIGALAQAVSCDIRMMLARPP